MWKWGGGGGGRGGGGIERGNDDPVVPRALAEERAMVNENCFLLREKSENLCGLSSRVATQSILAT